MENFSFSISKKIICIHYSVLGRNITVDSNLSNSTMYILSHKTMKYGNIESPMKDGVLFI